MLNSLVVWQIKIQNDFFLLFLFDLNKKNFSEKYWIFHSICNRKTENNVTLYVKESAIIHTQWMKLNLPPKSPFYYTYTILWAGYYQLCQTNYTINFIHLKHTNTISKYKIIKWHKLNCLKWSTCIFRMKSHDYTLYCCTIFYGFQCVCK